MTLRVTTTASGAGSGVAKWIRDAASAINQAIGIGDNLTGRMITAETDIIDLQATDATLQANKLQWVAAPSTATDPGTAGQIAYSSGFFYVCIATNTWVRTALTTF